MPTLQTEYITPMGSAIVVLRSRFLVLLVLYGSVLLAGCATMDESECVTVDWQERGTRDALDGRKRDFVGEHIKACREYGVEADVEAYGQGWDSGIKQYCTRDNGWQVGISNGVYGHTCPSELEAEFYSAYQLGRNVQQKKTVARNVRVELNHVLNKLAEQDPSDEERSHLEKERERLETELTRAEAEESRSIFEARQMGFPIY